VKVDLPTSEVEKCPTHDGRDVHRVPDRDVKLDPGTNPVIGRTGGKKK